MFELVECYLLFYKIDFLDYFVILFGCLIMLMDDEEEVIFGFGDIVVQQGVMYGWWVEGDQFVCLFVVLIDGYLVK